MKRKNFCPPTESSESKASAHFIHGSWRDSPLFIYDRTWVFCATIRCATHAALCAWAGRGRSRISRRIRTGRFRPESGSGRSHGNKHVHHQTEIPNITKTVYYYGATHTYRNHIAEKTGLPTRRRTIAKRHAILDFQAGKDVGLGLFGRDGASNTRFAASFASPEFTAKSERRHLCATAHRI